MTAPVEEMPAIEGMKIATIQRVVARHYNMTRSELLSRCRTAKLVRSRQVAVYLARTLTLCSLQGIGRHFSGRDHTTVLHAIRKIEAQLFEDTELARDVEMLRRELKELSSCSDPVEPDRGSRKETMMTTTTITPTIEQIAAEALTIYYKNHDIGAVLALFDAHMAQGISHVTCAAARDLVSARLRAEAKAGFDHADALEASAETAVPAGREAEEAEVLCVHVQDRIRGPGEDDWSWGVP